MEIDLGIPSALFAPPVREIVELGQSQLGFMNMFAIPLFQEVSDIMPAMKFCVDELNANKNSWKARVEEEQKKRKMSGDDTVRDGMRSPRSMSLAMPNGAADLNRTRTQPPRMYDAQDTRIKEGNQKTTPNLSDDIQMNDNRLKRPSCLLENDGNHSLGNNQINPVVNSTARHSSKPIPSQLQLRYATSSAPSLVDGPAKEPNNIGNLTSTDCALNDPPTPRPASKSHGTLRTSDTTDGSFSAPSSSDWASQATTATTSKLPLSPSTQGTSIMSTDSSAERTTLFPSHFSRPVTSPSITTPSTATSQSCPVFPRPSSSSNRDCSNTMSPPMVNSNHISIQKNGSTTIIETMRSLAKKPSRSKFRMSFWRRKTPPIPTQVNGAGHDPIVLGDGRLMGRS
jgi:3',5'-cyclic-nucleotide phosphodiesterase